MYAVIDHGCGCGGNCPDCQMGLAGMGLDTSTLPSGNSSSGQILSTAAAIDPEPYSKMALQMVSTFQKAWNTIEGWFGIGTGRREADVISPVQNGVIDRLAEILRVTGISPPAPMQVTTLQLQNFIVELQQTRAEFIRFVQDPHFTDGRASQQALNDVIPLIDDNIGKLSAMLIQMGGQLPGPGVTQGAGQILPRLSYPSTTWPAPSQTAPYGYAPGVETIQSGMDSWLMPALLAGAAWFALKKGRR